MKYRRARLEVNQKNRRNGQDPVSFATEGANHLAFPPFPLSASATSFSIAAATSCGWNPTNRSRTMPLGSMRKFVGNLRGGRFS